MDTGGHGWELNRRKLRERRAGVLNHEKHQMHEKEKPDLAESWRQNHGNTEDRDFEQKETKATKDTGLIEN